MDKFYRIKQVCEWRGCSPAQLYRDVAAKKFPAPIKLGPRMAVWVESELQAWLEAKREERDAGKPKGKKATLANGVPASRHDREEAAHAAAE